MFSENNRISARQTKYMLILDWTLRLAVLVPICLAGKTIGSLVACIVMGTILWSLVMRMVLCWLKPGERFCDAIARTAGEELAVIFCFAGLLFYLIQAAVFLNLGAELGASYLLPEAAMPVLCLLPLAAGVYMSCGSIEIRGRFCEVLGPVVLGLLIILAIFAGMGMEAYQYENTLVSQEDHLAAGSFEVFACIGGMFLPVMGNYLAEKGSEHQKGKNHLIRRNVLRAGMTAAALAGSLCMIAVGSYGKNGMAEIDFPVVRVMSNVKIPGGFFQRWDVVFLLLLLVCLTVTVAGSLWYMREFLRQIEKLLEESLSYYKSESQMPVTENAAEQGSETGNSLEKLNKGNLDGGIKVETPGRDYREGSCEQKYDVRGNLRAGSGMSWLWHNKVTVAWALGIILIYFLAVGFRSALNAVCYYRALNLQLLVPIMFFFYIIIGFQRRCRLAALHSENKRSVRRCRRAGREKRKVKAISYFSRMVVFVIIVLASVLLLSGCTSRELEERLFPMALEIGVEDEELVMTYAWNEGSGPAEAQTEENTENEEEAGALSRKGSDEQESENSEGDAKKQEAQIDLEKGAVTQKGLTVFRGSSLSDIHEQTTNFTERYLDYSHVKAIIIQESLAYAPQQQEVMKWLAGESAFATGLIVYSGKESGLTLEKVREQAGGQVGTYLERLYKNNNKYRRSAMTLGNLIVEYYANTSIS